MNTNRSESAPASQTAPLLSYFSTVFDLRVLLPAVLLGAGVAPAAEFNIGLLRFTENTSDGGVTVTGLNRFATGNIHDIPIPSLVNIEGINKPVTGIGEGALEPTYLGKVITGTVTNGANLRWIWDGFCGLKFSSYGVVL